MDSMQNEENRVIKTCLVQTIIRALYFPDFLYLTIFAQIQSITESFYKFFMHNDWMQFIKSR